MGMNSRPGRRDDRHDGGASPGPSRCEWRTRAPSPALLLGVFLAAFALLSACTSPSSPPSMVPGAGKGEPAGIPPSSRAGPGLAIDGDILAADTSMSGAQIDLLNFTLALAPGGKPVDLERLSITLSNGSTRTSFSRATPLTGNSDPGPDQWAVTGIVKGDDDATLEGPEEADICVRLAGSTGSVSAGDRFILVIEPEGGPSFSVTLTAPPVIDSLSVL
jgi:archaellin